MALLPVALQADTQRLDMRGRCRGVAECRACWTRLGKMHRWKEAQYMLHQGRRQHEQLELAVLILARRDRQVGPVRL